MDYEFLLQINHTELELQRGMKCETLKNCSKHSRNNVLMFLVLLQIFQPGLKLAAFISQVYVQEKPKNVIKFTKCQFLFAVKSTKY